MSSLLVRVKDLSPSAMLGSHLWSDALVECLRLVRVFFEDEDAATLHLRPMGADTGGVDEDGFLSAPAPMASLVVDKEPGLEPALAGLDSGWPDLGDTARRDRRTLSYAAIGLVVVLFGTAIAGMWRWHRMGDTSRPPAAEALFSETLDRSIQPE